LRVQTAVLKDIQKGSHGACFADIRELMKVRQQYLLCGASYVTTFKKNKVGTFVDLVGVVLSLLSFSKNLVVVQVK
jgi:hypothetical protein